MSKRMIDSELIEALGTDIKFDGKGNVKVGKNLEVGGKTKLLKGLEPIHTYSTPVIDGQSYDIDVYIQKYNDQSDTFGFMGILRYRNPVYDNSSYLVIGSYGFSYDPSKEGMISDLYACGYEDFRVNDSGGGKLLLFKYSESLNYLGSTAYLTNATGQPKLYRHKLRLNNLYRLTYDSTSNLNVGSVDDLRTIMNITSNSDSEVLPVCTEDGTAMAPLAITTHYCKVDGNDVTTVSDTVTAL